jgi:hypothetical protein
MHILDGDELAAKQLVEEGDGETGAQFVYRCSRVALDRWRQETPAKQAPQGSEVLELETEGIFARV